MLETIIDYTIFDEFTKKQPKPLPLGNEEENQIWNSFWSFLKCGTDVNITNYDGQQNIFLNLLTSGRKGTTCKLQEKFNKPHKFRFPKNQNINSIFFLKEESSNGKEKYRKNNGFVFGFNDDFLDVWKEISLINRPKVLPVRKRAGLRFSSWKQLKDYALPFTDMIIVDNYMLDESVWDFNLFEIIKHLAANNSVAFNLLLLSFIKEKNLPEKRVRDLHEKISQKLSELNIRCNLSIALATQEIKEHDRGVFTNYIRIKSGDSFVYFNRNGHTITHGTDIDFHPLVENDKFNAYEAALKDISRIIKVLKDNPTYSRTRIAGNMKNMLIDSL